MDLPSIEGLGVEGDGGRVAALGTADGDLAAELHPRHGEDGAGVGAGQREHVLLVVLQQAQHPWEQEQEEEGGGASQGQHFLICDDLQLTTMK